MKMRIRFYFLLLFSTRLPIKVLVKADGYAQELELKSVEDSEVKTSEIGPKLIQSQIPSTSTSQDIFQSFLQLVKDQINNALSSSTNETSAVDSMEFNKELHEDDKPVQDQVEVPDKSYEVLSILDKLIAANNDDRSSAIEQPFKPSISANNLDVFEDEVKEESFPQLEKHGSNSFYVEDVAPFLPEGYHKANSDDGIEEVISRDQESPIVGGDIESKTSDEENQHKQPSNEDFKYGNTVNLHNDKGIEEMPNSLTGVLRSFGKVTTTTVDPIAALLSNIEIVDVSQYIPRGYVYSQELETFEQMFSFGPNSNINDLLEDEEFKKMKLNRKSKELDLDSYESNSNKVSSMKPGRLVGSQLAMMSKQLKRKQAEARNKAEEDLYLATFGGAQIETTDSQKSESKYGWRTEEEIDETDLSNLFESLLVNPNGPKEGSVAKETPSRPLVRPTTTMSTKPTTATTLRTTTLGVCGQFCGLFGSIGIRSGIPWSDNLNHPYTQEYKNLKEEFDKRCSLIFNRMYFGSSFEFCSVEAFTKRGDEMSVEVNLQFSGLVFNLTSTSILDSFTEELDVDGDEVHWMGEYVVNLRSSYFLVVDTELLNNAENLVFGIYGVEFPDWALLVLIAGIMLVFIIAMVGVITSVKRYNQSVEVKRRVLNVKTLKALRGGEHFDVVECGSQEKYKKDKRDLWTLQRVLATERRTRRTRRGDDSGNETGSSKSSRAYRMFEKIVSMKSLQGDRERDRKRRPPPSQRSHQPDDLGLSVNDSNAGLLGDLDTTEISRYLQDTTEVNNKAGFDNMGYEESDYEAVDRIFDSIHDDSPGRNVDFQADCKDNISRNHFLKNLEIEESSESDGSSEIL